MLQTYSKKINIKNVRNNATTTDTRISHTTCVHFYKYKLKAITCTISPNYNTPVCAHIPTSKISSKTPTPRKAQQHLKQITSKPRAILLTISHLIIN